MYICLPVIFYSKHLYTCIFAYDCACVSKHTLIRVAPLHFMCMSFSQYSFKSSPKYIFYAVDPPKVNQHPKSQFVLNGTRATFKVEATGDDLTFQWQKDGSDVHNDSNYSGTDTNTLMIQEVKKSDGGCYSCLVKNEAKIKGKVSDEVQLTVCE